MISVLSDAGKKKYGLKEYVVDKTIDISSLPVSGPMGSAAYVIETGDIYLLNGEEKWVLSKFKSSSSGSSGGSGSGSSGSNNDIYDGGVEV